MNILVLCDDYWHPARNARAGLKPLATDEFAFDFIENAADWSEERMSAYPVTILTKSNNVSATYRANWMPPEVEVAFRNYVSAGNGLLVIHSGSAEYSETTILRHLLGGLFASHPPQCPVTVRLGAGHPLTAGSAPFTQTDEHYMMAMNDPGVDVFLTTTSEHGSQPGGWTRNEGAGRVCVLTPGHNLAVWLEPAYQVIIRNALHWCGKQG